MPRATALILVGVLAASSGAAVLAQAARPPAQHDATPPATAEQPPPPQPGRGGFSAPNDDPFPSTYRPMPARPLVIRNARIMTAAGPTIPNGSIVVRDGKIVAVGATVDAPADAEVIDAQGKFVTPGIIDDHSHLGVYAAPGVHGAQRRQRDDQPEHRRSVGRALGVAAGSAVPAQPGRRRHDDPGAARARPT